MTKNDVKQYLEKIYKIDVLDVTTLIKQGKENRHPVSAEIIDPDPDRKFAFVFLVKIFDFLFFFVEIFLFFRIEKRNIRISGHLAWTNAVR